MPDICTDQRPTQDDGIDSRCAEKLLSYAIASYQLHVDNFNKLDSKAATLAGFVGLVIAVSTGVFKPVLGLPEAELEPGVSLVVSTLYAASVLLLAAAFCFCLLTLKARVNANPASADDMIRHYRSLGPIVVRERQLVKDIVKTYSEAERTRRRNNELKSRHLQAATDFLFVALFAAVSGYVTQYFTLMTGR